MIRAPDQDLDQAKNLETTKTIKWTWKGLCEFVTYGGCGGSINMFDSEDECYEGCAEFGAEKPKKANKKN